MRVAFAALLIVLILPASAFAAGKSPRATFTVSPAAPVTGQAVTFDASASVCFGSGGWLSSNCSSYSWADDGDASDPLDDPQWPLGTGKVLSFTFQGAGTKYVWLTLRDGAGRQTQTMTPVVVTNAPPPPPPAAQCADGVDNDGDGKIDYPADPGCASATDDSESPDPPPSTGCDQTVSGGSVVSAASSAPNGSTVCVTAGSYGAVTFSAARTGYVAVQPAAGATVTFADLNTSGSASWYKFRGLHVSAMVDIGNRTTSTGSHITLEQSYTPGASSWIGMTDVVLDHNRFENGGNQFESLGGTRLTLNGNQFINPGCDAMFVTTGYRDVVITNNEITGVIEAGCHADAFQSCGCSGHAGDNLTFSGNWEHDNFGQGFFIKDGDVAGVTYENNLFERQTGIGSQSNIWQVTNLVMRHNTQWDNKAFLFRGGSAAGPAQVDHNVLQQLGTTDAAWPGVTSADNWFGEIIDPSWWPTGATDHIGGTPPFADVAAHDYRLTDGSGRGVDWKPSDKVFGP